MPELRRAGPTDLVALMDLEAACYDASRRQSRESLRTSLRSDRQQVWVMEDSKGLAAALVLWFHPRTVRIYGVHVRPDLQGKGFGRAMVRHAERQARHEGRERIILEADASDERLLDWYCAQGYVRVVLRTDFYAVGRDAWRMEKRVRTVPARPGTPSPTEGPS